MQDLVEPLISRAESANEDVDDPHRCQFGSQSRRSGRALSASVSPNSSPEWFDIVLTAHDEGGTPLTRDVEFHLHPTFKPSVRREPALNGQATGKLLAWGAFTVAAVADNGLTRLELNLADIPDAPLLFKQR